MNILISGASGLIGSNLADKLAKDGHYVVGLLHDKLPLIRHCDVSYVKGNITDFNRMLEIMVDYEIDQVFHCASKAVVRNCNQDPIGCFSSNVMGTVAILEAAVQSKRVSGVLCMESDKSFGPGPIPYKESQVLHPLGIYEASKACVSQIVPAYHATYGLPVFGIRSANVYGPGDRHRSRVIPNTILRLFQGQRPVITDGAQEFIREYIFVDDFVRYATSLMSCKPWGKSINVGSGRSLSVSDLICTIACMMGKPDVPVDVLPRATTFLEIPEQKLDLTLLHSLVSTRCGFTFGLGLLETIEWYRRNISLFPSVLT